ncbi:unnamed protein product, partial [Rotaria sp. Silwood2]
MLLNKGIMPALEFVGQSAYLIQSYQYVQQFGILCSSYRSWFFDDFPGTLPEVESSQRSPQYFNLVQELALIAVKFYIETTLAQSPSLQSVARQSSYESIKSNWSAAAMTRHEVSSGDMIKLLNVVRGISAALL